MNILLTGASRGIGAATLDTLIESGHQVAGHSTRGNDGLIAADLCRLAVSHFREHGGGRIVNVASRAAFRGDSPQHWHYAASKSAMIGMTRTIARGYAADKILAFAVAPGFTVTDATEEYLEGRGGAQILADIPLGRVTSPAEVAEAIRWLAIDAPAASTGSVIDLNGASYVR